MPAQGHNADWSSRGLLFALAWSSGLSCLMRNGLYPSNSLFLWLSWNTYLGSSDHFPKVKGDLAHAMVFEAVGDCAGGLLLPQSARSANPRCTSRGNSASPVHTRRASAPCAASRSLTPRTTSSRLDDPAGQPWLALPMSQLASASSGHTETMMVSMSCVQQSQQLRAV